MNLRRRKSALALEEEKLLSTPLVDLSKHVYLARQKKPSSRVVICLEVGAILLVVALSAYSFCYMEKVHFHLTHMYAHLGYPNAQHLLAHKYLQGVGIETNHTAAFQWFRKAADLGHPHSAYNLAVGHMQGYRTDVRKGEARTLIKFASNNGVDEAASVLRDTCSRGHCDH